MSLEWQASTKAIDDKISFLDLPKELRDIVYEHVLQVPGAIFIYTKPHRDLTLVFAAKNIREKNTGPPEPVRLAATISPSMLRICRQLHAECSQILYGRNSFRFYMSESDFAPAVYAPLVRQLTLVSSLNSRTALMDETYLWLEILLPKVLWECKELLRRFPNLENMTFLIHASNRPYFLISQTIDRTERIAKIAASFKATCFFGTPTVHSCMHLELTPPPSPPCRRVARVASSPVITGTWDVSEFSEAFDLMKQDMLNSTL